MFRKRWIKVLLLIIAILIIIYFFGPHPKTPVYSEELPNVPANAAALENYIDSNEAQHKLKPDNEARIIWFDSNKTKTEYSIVYLHGFSASQAEGRPINANIATGFG